MGAITHAFLVTALRMKRHSSPPTNGHSMHAHIVALHLLISAADYGPASMIEGVEFDQVHSIQVSAYVKCAGPYVHCDN
jgi:hypothetical protein